MSLAQRVYSLETEYGIAFRRSRTSTASQGADQKLLRHLLVGALTARFGAGGEYLRNGGRAYEDDQTPDNRGHPEVSLPECLSAREVVVYDKAAELMIQTVLGEVQQELAQRHFAGTVFVVKNNVDSTGHTFGCHENYSTLRNTETLSSSVRVAREEIGRKFDADLLKGQTYLQYTAHCLLPYLVSRQILCGSGHFVPQGTAQPSRFEISQRAPFINSIHSVYSGSLVHVDHRGPISMRGIMDLSREADSVPLATGDQFRMHMILGDANMSGWAAWMKLGMTGIVLRMIEDLYITDVPILALPVDALHQISRDPTCQVAVELADHRTATAIDIQRRYLELAQQYFAQFSANDEERAIVDEWQHALDDLAGEGMAALANRSDWAFKLQLMQSTLARQGKSLDRALDNDTITGLREFDLRYHQLGPEGLFAHIPPTTTRMLVGDDEVRQASVAPPRWTRAVVRRDALDLMPELKVKVSNWDTVSIDECDITVPDPLDFGDAKLFAYCVTSLDFPQDHHRLRRVGAKRMIDRWTQALTHTDAAIRTRAVRYLSWWRTPQSAHELAQIARADPDVTVRCTALQAIGRLGVRTETVMNAVLDCSLQVEDITVRHTAASVWERLAIGK